MSLNFGKIVNPLTAPFEFNKAIGADYTPAQQNMIDDWTHGKFQRSDIAISRGVANKTIDQAIPGLHMNERLGNWFENKMPNTFGEQHGTAEANRIASNDQSMAALTPEAQAEYLKLMSGQPQ